jgi:hypothetical protein
MTDKWGRRLFKIGAATLLLLGLVHSISFFIPMVPANETERQLLELMANYKFNLLWSMCSMAGLMRGFSISFMVAAFGFGVLDFSLSNERAGLLKRIALINVLWLAVMTGVSLYYFFALPTSFLLAGLLIFALAWLKLPVENTL